MAVLKGREVTFNRFVGSDDRRVHITNKDGTSQIVDLSEVQFSEDEKEVFQAQNVWSLRTISDKELGEIRDSQDKELIRIREGKPVLEDDGQPMLDKDGKPVVDRKVADQILAERAAVLKKEDDLKKQEQAKLEQERQKKSEERKAAEIKRREEVKAKAEKDKKAVVA